MGTYKQGILGPFSGKVGQVVGANWRGIYYMRSLAPHVANPRTPAQVAQRNKLSVCVKALRPWLEVLDKGFQGQNGAKGWSGAIRENLGEVTESEQGAKLTFDNMIFTNSTIATSIQIQVANGKATITWTAQDTPEISDSGQLIFAAKSPTKNNVFVAYARIRAERTEIINDILQEECDYVAFFYDSNISTAATKATHTPAG